MSKHKKTVIIIGAGFVGLRVFRELRGLFDIVIIEPKDFYESIPSVDNMINPEGAHKVLVDYSAEIKSITKSSYVTSIKQATSDSEKGSVTLKDGQIIEFDYCVIGSGSSYGAVKTDPTSMATRENRIASLVTQKQAMVASDHIIIVGSGSVGVEVASGIAEAFPEKKITMISSTSRLLDRFSQKASDYATNWFQNHKNVTILYNEKVTDWGILGNASSSSSSSTATIVTDKGTSITGFVIKCIGFKPASGPFASSFTSDQIAPSGAIKVEATLQVVGAPLIFAAGDVAETPIPYEKTANYADFSGFVVATNIKALEAQNSGGTISELQTFPDGLFGGPAPFISGATLGRKDGIMQMGDDVQTGGSVVFIHNFFARMLMGSANGYRVWTWLLGSIKNMFLGQIRGLAKKSLEAT